MQHPGAPVYHKKHSSRPADTADCQAASVAALPPKRPHNWAQPANSDVSAVTRAAAAAAAMQIRMMKVWQAEGWVPQVLSAMQRLKCMSKLLRDSVHQAWQHCCRRVVNGPKLISTCGQLLAQGLVPASLLLRECQHIPPRSKRPAQERGAADCAKQQQPQNVLRAGVLQQSVHQVVENYAYAIAEHRRMGTISDQH